MFHLTCALRFLWALFVGAPPRSSSAAAAGAEDLVRRAKKMDPEAWDEIFNRYYPEIYAYLRYRVPTPEDAEDLAATVFERAVRHIRTYKETGKGIGAWLQRIATNLVADYYRRQKVPGRQADPLPLSLEDTEPSPLEHALRVDTVEDVHRALEQLPEAQRDVLIYRFLLGYSLAETAAILGKNVNAVKALQHRAVERLRRVWKVTHEEG